MLATCITNNVYASINRLRDFFTRNIKGDNDFVGRGQGVINDRSIIHELKGQICWIDEMSIKDETFDIFYDLAW